MAISKIKGSAIQDATIPEEKLEDEAGSFRMILDGTDGSATNAGDFLLLDATASSTNVGEQFLFEPATDDGSAVLSGDLNLEMDKKSTIKSEGGAVTTNIGQGLAKAWISFANTSGTPASLKSINLASITDSGVGHYGLNLTNAFTDNEYCVTLSASSENGFGGVACVDLPNTTASKTQMYTIYNNANTIADYDRNNAKAHGDLA